MRALLTGITGFAGGHLAQSLTQRGDEVFGIARNLQKDLSHLSPNIDLITTDLRDAAAVINILKKVQPDVIYHLAAQAFVPTAWANPWDTLENNIHPQLNILQAMITLELPSRLLVVASDQLYGLVGSDELPVHELTPMRPNNPYGVSKLTQDMLGLQYHLSHQLDIVRVRTFNHIGPRQNPLFVAANFAKQIAEIELNLCEPIIHVGNLEAKRDFTDVYDVVQAYILVVEHGKTGEVYNVGTGQPHSIQYLLDVLLGYSHCGITVKQDPNRMRPADIPAMCADNRKLKAQTNWKPTISFEQSLERVLNYWRDQVKKETMQ